MKKMGSNFIKGKSLLSISLPIDIFESRSNLERYAYSFVYVETFILKWIFEFENFKSALIDTNWIKKLCWNLKVDCRKYDKFDYLKFFHNVYIFFSNFIKKTMKF